MATPRSSRTLPRRIRGRWRLNGRWRLPAATLLAVLYSCGRSVQLQRVFPHHAAFGARLSPGFGLREVRNRGEGKPEPAAEEGQGPPAAPRGAGGESRVVAGPGQGSVTARARRDGGVRGGGCGLPDFPPERWWTAIPQPCAESSRKQCSQAGVVGGKQINSRSAAKISAFTPVCFYNPLRHTN